MKKVKAAHDRIVAARTREKGLLIVHAGNGKGKTSAAPGMVVRAIDHAMKVGVIQFIKGAMTTGEKAVFDAFPDQVRFKPMGEGFTWNTQDRARDVAVAREAWDEVKHVIVTGRNAPDRLIDMANLVNEMTMVKHPFRAGVNAQKGSSFRFACRSFAYRPDRPR